MHAYTCDCDRQSLDALVRGKELELEQAAEAYRNLQWLKQQSEEKERNTLREKDTIIGQLQAALQTHSQETQVTYTDIHFIHAFVVMASDCLLCNFQCFVKTNPHRQTCATCFHKHNRCADTAFSCGCMFLFFRVRIGSDSRPRCQSSGRSNQRGRGAEGSTGA